MNWTGTRLETNDVRVAIGVAAGQNDVALLEWIDDKALKSPQTKECFAFTGLQGGQVKSGAVPDGYFYLETARHNLSLFLEVDQGTATGQWDRCGRRTWAKKLRSYLGCVDI